MNFEGAGGQNESIISLNPVYKGTSVDINETKQSDITILALKGRLDAATSPALESALAALCQANVKKVLVDCRELEYISSAGLRVLLAAAKNFKRIDGAIALCTLSATVQQVFEISGFTSIFALYATRDEALTALA